MVVRWWGLGEERLERFESRGREWGAGCGEVGVWGSGAEVGGGVVGRGRELVAGGEEVVGTGGFDELVGAVAGRLFFGVEIAGVEGTEVEVLTEEDVQAAVDGLDGRVAKED